MANLIEYIDVISNDVDIGIANRNEDADLHVGLSGVCPDSLVKTVTSNVDVDVVLDGYDNDSDVIKYLQGRGYFVYDEEQEDAEQV